eukprot:CAMPEP_0196745494 /NCGR_PEP_ID=MMETSP1091-20130531/61966_1 /TAXON_ID=302021 /ORGANISM="Rhodomonas sp., Strain CCMP768" /LENGTH=36 /DNA_ID= /DNA_START= /DNA_END= /DNA_ORIENTATION=
MPHSSSFMPLPLPHLLSLALTFFVPCSAAPAPAPPA